MAIINKSKTTTIRITMGDLTKMMAKEYPDLLTGNEYCRGDVTIPEYDFHEGDYMSTKTLGSNSEFTLIFESNEVPFSRN